MKKLYLENYIYVRLFFYISHSYPHKIYPVLHISYSGQMWQNLFCVCLISYGVNHLSHTDGALTYSIFSTGLATLSKGFSYLFVKITYLLWSGANPLNVPSYATFCFLLHVDIFIKSLISFIFTLFEILISKYFFSI